MYEYVEFIAKNNQHRFKDIPIQSKSVKAFAVPGLNKCPVKILEYYLSKLPASTKVFYMYLWPHENVPSGYKPWYINVPVGINTLQKMLPKMSDQDRTIVFATQIIH